MRKQASKPPVDRADAPREAFPHTIDEGRPRPRDVIEAQRLDFGKPIAQPPRREVVAPDVPAYRARRDAHTMLKDAGNPGPDDDHPPREDVVAPAGSLTFAQLVRPGVAAVRSNWRPFVLIQMIAALLVAGYFVWDPMSRFFGQIARWREGSGVSGLLFVSISTVCAAVLLPEIAKALTQRGWRADAERLRDIGFLVLFFALHGLLVDGFYRLLALLIGPGNDIGTVTTKTLIDMFLFGPLVAQPWTIFAFDLRRNGFDFARTTRNIGLRWYAERALPLQVPAWAFWTPMVVLIYALPPTLQIVLWTGAMGAWSLVMVFIGRGESRA